MDVSKEQTLTAICVSLIETHVEVIIGEGHSYKALTLIFELSNS